MELVKFILFLLIVDIAVLIGAGIYACQGMKFAMEKPKRIK